MNERPCVVAAMSLAASLLLPPFLAAQCANGPQFGLPVHDPDVPLAILRVAHGDFDRDGDQDLAFRSGGTLYLRRNDGAGALSIQPSLPSTSPIGDMAFGDWDRDGWLDIATVNVAAVANLREVRFQVWRNTGPAGTFVGFALTQDVQLSVPHLSAPITNLAAADLDSDGILDVVVDDGRGWCRVLRGDGGHGIGTGTFHPPVGYQTFLGGNADLAICDTNGDGAQDVVIAEAANLQNRLFVIEGLTAPQGQPLGTFGTMHTAALLPQGTRYALTVRDLDADGLPEAVLGFYGEIRIHKGLGGFSFAPAAVFPQMGSEIPIVGDFDRDGTVDIGVPCSVNALIFPNFWVLRDPMGAAVWSYHTVDTGYPQNGVTIDQDNDGILDLVVGKIVGRLTTVPGTCFVQPPPGIAVTTPNGAEQWVAGTKQTIAWSVQHPVASFDVDVSFDDGLTWVAVARDVAGASCEWWVHEPATSQARVRVMPSSLPVFADTSDATFHIGGPGLASALPLGTGCGVPFVPVATASAPRLGTTSVLTMANASPNQFAVWWMSLPIAPALPLGSPGCFVHLHPALLGAQAIGTTDATGRFVHDLVVPALPGLVGLQVAVQATAFVAASPLGLQVGNGILLTLGN
jgi:hypothetical protein